MIPDITSNNTHYFLDGKPLYFHANNYLLSTDRYYFTLDKIQITRTDTGYICTIDALGCQSVTMVIPCGHRYVIMGDEYEYIDMRVRRKFYCKGPTQILDTGGCMDIYAPVVHLVKPHENAWSCSVFGESIISCCVESYEQYVEITGIPDNHQIQFHIDVSSNYKSNLQRLKINKRHFKYHDILDIHDINNAIYYGAILERTTHNIDSILQDIKNIQKEFNQRGLYTIITGSVAAQLNGIDRECNDCDFMTKTKEEVIYAQEILKSIGYIERSDKKFSHKHDDLIPIDISHDNYNITSNYPKYVKESHELRFFDLEGLMWLSLLNCYEFHRTSYEYNYIKNDKILFDLTKQSYNQSRTCNSVVGREIQQIYPYTEQCEHLCTIIQNENMIFEDIRINEPFRVNCFGSEHKRYFSIINLGSCNNVRLVSPSLITSAIWTDVSEKETQTRIENHDNFTIIFIDKIEWPGILVCEVDNVT